MTCIVLGWKALRSTSSIEFHRDWNIHINETTGEVKVQGRARVVSNAVYIGGSGFLEVRTVTPIPLGFVKSEAGPFTKNDVNLYFAGNTDWRPTPSYYRKHLRTYQGKLLLKVSLSDGTAKRYRGKVYITPGLESDTKEPQVKTPAKTPKEKSDA